MSDNLATATLGGGCFWCQEAVFKDLRGVASVKSGYAGGSMESPTYKQVCSGRTGHAEVVQVRFDPSAISYADLLRVFCATHDPTTKDRQGHDVGTQYRSIILAHDAAQEATARAVMAEVAPVWSAPLVTQLVPFETFWPAEDEHDDYFARNPWTGYCQAVVGPKVAKFRKSFADRLKRPAA